VRRTRALATIVLSLAAVGCDRTTQIGVGEAFRVRDAQFVRGELPGDEPKDLPPVAVDGGSDEDPPRITALETFNLDVRQGQGAKAFRGRTSDSAVAVAIALEGVSTGYWVLPVGSTDPATGEYTWEASTDFDISIDPGRHALRVVAIDKSERAGTQLELKVCVRGRVADNGSACSPTRTPPRAVISLSWDANADLDLQVVGPGGQVFDSKRSSGPASGTLGDAGSESSELPALDRDSNAGCVIDAIRTENLSWNEESPSGRYGLYVNLFDACKQAAVRFRVAVYTPREKGSDAGEILEERYARSGELLDLAVNPTSSRGLFLGEYRF
jgi:hypothetical protein